MLLVLLELLNTGIDFLTDASEPRSLTEESLFKLGLCNLLPAPKLFLGSGFAAGSLYLVLYAPCL